ncbi:MAG TPA: neutral zinc metallopeptidase [Longimicrobiales bacterium]|nr:neutral zinc metallopeptidase [Longimicrobiales bacterium]
MRWQGGRRSGNIQDRRGRGPALAGGGIGVILITLVAVVLGVDPSAIVTGGGGAVESGPTAEPGAFTGVDEEADFVAAVLGDTEVTWHELFDRRGLQYREPQLVLFENAVNSACGFAQSAVGPFYCPRDLMLYLDLSFFRELHERFGAPGDFARAYVIAHEVGHHVQTLLGVTEQVRAAQSRASQAESNALQVRMELQADCLAGVWGFHARTQRGMLEAGDLESALRAAAAIGDDRLQREGQGRVVPETFTHGTSAQRMEWFRRGFDNGDPASCDTFT